MFQRISERIIEPVRPANVRGRRWTPSAALLILVLWAGAVATEASPAFDRSTFNKISFSGGCDQKEWSLMPDNTLKILLGPSGKGLCEAVLEFYFPENIDAQSGISFEARRWGPHSSIQLGIQETPEGPVIYSPSAPSGGLTSQWQEMRVRFDHFKGSKTPPQIASLHVAVIPGPSVNPAGASAALRQIQFFTPPSAVSPTASYAVPAVAAPKAAVPAVPRFRTSWAGLRSLFRSMAGKLPPLGAGLLLIGLVKGARHRRRRIISPLYEINTRTWKTHFDDDHVVQFGGFKKIGLSDLKAIKQAGFNALWLMGIWEVGPKVRDISRNYGEDFHGSPFAIFDYAVSNDLGTEQDFRDLVQRAHSQRLSVIVDFIPNHMGLDCAWLNDHPEYFIHRVVKPDEKDLSDEVLKERYPGYFPYRTPSYPEGSRRVPKTIMVAYGKDPYFYPWIDTAQLDYASPGLRQRMIDILCSWAKTVDGVRCDMAMLVLREQIKIHRHPDMSWDAFNHLMPQEFWSEAIQAAKRINPNFVFLAETYWSMEGPLQNLGFDYTYNKPLYEAICGSVHSGHADGLMNFLRILGTDFLKRSVHFLENHDEERAMNALGEDRQRAAATILCTLPGVALLHHGQLEGKRERLPVQRVVPLHKEPEHHALHHFYRRLLKATSLPVFQEGRLTPLYSNNGALGSYVRTDADTKVWIVVNTSGQTQKGSVFPMPGLSLKSGTAYRLNDLYYEFKNAATPGVRPSYVYPAARLINQGLYVELEPFDAHIFVVEPQTVLPSTQKVLSSVRDFLDEWPLNRVARALLGAAFTRSSDTNLAANPPGRPS